jgi:hypothetical protein
MVRKISQTHLIIAKGVTELFVGFLTRLAPEEEVSTELENVKVLTKQIIIDILTFQGTRKESCSFCCHSRNRSSSQAFISSHETLFSSFKRIRTIFDHKTQCCSKGTL